MATLTAKVQGGESVKLWPWAKVEPQVRHGGSPAGAPLQTQAASAAGVVTFAGVTSRVEYAAQRADGSFVKLLDSTTRGGAP